MRPRRFRRGTRKARLMSGALFRRFNEAPAISPGNRIAYLHYATNAHRGFNEAPAISPGNISLDFIVSSTMRSASMRPRRFRRGTFVSSVSLVR